MKHLLNATNLVVGGGIQVAASFIVEAVRHATCANSCGNSALLKEYRA